MQVEYIASIVLLRQATISQAFRSKKAAKRYISQLLKQYGKDASSPRITTELVEELYEQENYKTGYGRWEDHRANESAS